ncbi:MAG: methylated-DNA--[protein]-cysteine S-methyltransferase [Propioniciclava sp.]
MTRHRIIDSPIGPLTLVVSGDDALTGLYTEGQAHEPEAEDLGEADDTIADEAVRQLGEYFAGTRTDFDLTLAPEGTPFQNAVWERLGTIPYGQTRSYGEIATALGRPSAARAVGAATGRNPLSIVVPCHRLVGVTGNLTGYAGGIDRKTWLLRHEGALP